MCGIFGCIGRKDAVDLTLMGLFCLQHRGHESAGIAVWDANRPRGERLKYQKRIGIVSHLREKLNSAEFKGMAAIGHNRYGTTGGTGLANAQPLKRKIAGTNIALVHNGDLVKVDFKGACLSVKKIRQLLEAEGVPFETGADTEIILNLLARAQDGDLIERIIKILETLYGAYSLMFLYKGHLIAARDPWGFRPLWLGKDDSSFVFSSEDYPFCQLGLTPIREVKPGEVVIITPSLEVISRQLKRQVFRLAHCAFEYVYFARPDSVIFGQSVSQVRKRFGRELAIELIAQGKLPPIDKVIPVLDSGGVSSFTFAQVLLRERVRQMLVSGVSPEQVPDELFPFDFGLVRNHYSGRNFITPGQQMREKEVDLKHSVDRRAVAGKNIASGDDSIVRSTTAKRHATKYRAAGARKVSTLVFSPPIIASCYYGIDTKCRGELVASSKSIEEIRQQIGADFLHYLSLEGFKKCLGSPENFCLACFTGEYPIPITD